MELPTPPAAFDPDAEPLNILCMDGGGIRGRNLMVMIEEIEAVIGRPIAECFDLVAGTSIGGCGALIISQFPAHGEAVQKARQAFYNLQVRCFAHKRLGSLLRRGHLCRDERRAVVLELCGAEQPLRLRGSQGPRAFAVATRQSAEGGIEPYLLRTYSSAAEEAPPRREGREGREDRERPTSSQGRGGSGGAKHAPKHAGGLPGTSDAQLWQAVEATSAAPAIFPPTRLRGDLLVDGGLVANDPTLLALREAHALWPGRPVGLVVSLGTGIPSPQSEPTSGVAEAVRQAGPKARYFRFQPQVRGVGMIETDEARLREMEGRVRASFRMSIEAREVCRLLALSAASSRRRLPLSLERASRAWEGWARTALEQTVLAHAAHRCRRVRGTALQSFAQGWAVWAVAQQVLLAWRRLIAALLGCSLAARQVVAAGPLVTYLQWWWQGGIYAPSGASPSSHSLAAAAEPTPAQPMPTPAGSVAKNNVLVLPARAWWPSRRQPAGYPALRGVAVGLPLSPPLAPPRLSLRGLRGGLSADGIEI